MKAAERNVLWRKYLNACWAGGTKEQRKWAFDNWFREEMKDVESQSKRAKAKALR